MLIKANNVTLSIDGRVVLMDENLTCSPGEITGLVGPSGCGKTSLLQCLGGLTPVDAGTITADGETVSALRSKGRRVFWRDHAAFILQDHGIMDDETVGFNVTMRSNSRFFRANKQRLEEVLTRTGLGGRSAETASHLSGGEKQRLALARAMFKQANVLYADEPTASLDEENRRLVIAMLQSFAASGRTVIVATHDDEMIDACMNVHEVGQGSSKQTAAAVERGEVV